MSKLNVTTLADIDWTKKSVSLGVALKDATRQAWIGLSHDEVVLLQDAMEAFGPMPKNLRKVYMLLESMRQWYERGGEDQTAITTKGVKS